MEYTIPSKKRREEQAEPSIPTAGPSGIQNVAWQDQLEPLDSSLDHCKL